MASPAGTLLRTQLARWFGARGFWLVVAAALVPLVLTGSWVATHQADVAVTELTWDPTDVEDGGNVTFTATVKNLDDAPVGSFNVSLVVGQVQGRNIIPVAQERVELEGLDPGEVHRVTLAWSARAGPWGVVADADTQDDIGEKEEFNNQRYEPFVVRYPQPDPEDAPTRGNLTGDPASNASADLVIEELTWDPAEPAPGTNTTVTLTVTNRGPDTAPNATITLRVLQRSPFGDQYLPVNRTREVASLGPDDPRTLTLSWPARRGTYWIEATANASAEVHDPDGASNHRVEPLVVQPQPPEDAPPAPDRTTLKGFYRLTLDFLFLTLLVPFISLFYAGGVIEDERKDGTLPYLLTRPLPRPLLPLTKFAAGYAVSAVAIVAGLVLTYLVLFGVGEGAVTFLTAPILLALLSLFVYGALFTLLALLVDRPYLVGVGFVVGWEAIVGSFVPWVQNLTVSYHVGNLVAAWWNVEDLVFRTLPEGENATNAILVLVGAGLTFLAASAWVMKTREFADV